MDIENIDRECLIEESQCMITDNNDFNNEESLSGEASSMNENEAGNMSSRHDEELLYEECPTEGMLFSTPDEAFKFYNKYALKMGFGIRKSSTNSARNDRSKIIGRKFVCDKQGMKKFPTETKELYGNYSRAVRLGCNANMLIRLTMSESWIVTKLILKHNHEMSKSSKHRSHKKIHRQPIVKNLITQLNREGISNASIARVVNTFEPDPSHVITSQQVHDHLRVERKNNLGKSCTMIVKHFLNKKERDEGFFFNIEVADDLTIRSVFWADRRSQESYKKFSDVIIFDVTYRTNNFSLPFAPFTGINHHRQSCLFGCALLADETEDTFVWLFEQWLTCMGMIEPTVIITDQDAAMGNAIAKVFPNTLHRYCDWHLNRNIAENLVHLKATHGQEFEEYFNKLRMSDTTCEADRCWEELMTKYNLRERSWLPKLWDKRKSWLPCYLKNTFSAGARSSQRAESINSFFDTFVNARTPLHEFVLQYDKALTSRRRAEEDADFNTMNSIPVPTLGWSLEEDAGKCYTSAMFTLFHKQLKDGMHYWADKINKERTITTYKVGREGVDKSQWKVVTFDSFGVVVSCQCKYFETFGLLCRHALCILWKKHITKIPDRYVLKRWTIGCRYHSVDIGFEKDVATSEVDRELMWGIRYKITKVIEEAYKSPMFAEEIDKILTRKLAEVHSESAQDHGTQFSQCASNSIPEITIRDPAGAVRTKGRPRPASRFRSSLEISQDDGITKKRTCGNCGEKGHYRTGCPNEKQEH